ncbi:hypothetical protein Rmf_25370 [Roseomonas fluvialis]|uniref:Uncharacterized protein n=1 Tax=Roseomonas fluvialis TaxID=1750527 RepID=A0ABM7Y404_9PROT|nr:hypothetical protein Rmf_25370 [Roseomonas fluvialis]
MFEHGLDGIQFVLGEAMDVALDEAADHQVGLLGSAMERAEHEAAAARVEILGFGHGLCAGI